MKKCNRFIKSKGAKCGMSAEMRSVRGQHVGAFCFPCWLVVMETLPLEMFFRRKFVPGSLAARQARRVVHEEHEKLRKQWIEECRRRGIPEKLAIQY